MAEGGESRFCDDLPISELFKTRSCHIIQPLVLFYKMNCVMSTICSVAWHKKCPVVYVCRLVNQVLTMTLPQFRDFFQPTMSDTKDMNITLTGTHIGLIVLQSQKITDMYLPPL